MDNDDGNDSDMVAALKQLAKENEGVDIISILSPEEVKTVDLNSVTSPVLRRAIIRARNTS